METVVSFNPFNRKVNFTICVRLGIAAGDVNFVQYFDQSPLQTP
jgi:hypothetical protein